MLETQYWALLGLIFYALLLVAQSLIATIAHRRQSQYIPGIIASDLGHDSFVFRSHRTYCNSLENAPFFVIPALVGIVINVDANVLGYLVWGYVLARIGHMVLYYFIATEKNPSPRSYFYLLGFLINLALLIWVSSKFV